MHPIRSHDVGILDNHQTLFLLAPATFVFLVLLVSPIVFLIHLSLLPSMPNAPLTGPIGFNGYAELGDSYHLGILWRTIRISGITTLGCLLLGYPIALSIIRSRGWWRSAQIVFVVTPLFVSIVVRTYGWVLLLGNRGLINGLLAWVGFRDQPVRLLGTEAAVVIGLMEALLPFMVLSLSAVLSRIDSTLEEAARGLGASPIGAFLTVTLPLSLPGALAGCLLVFMVSMGSYVTPALLGGSEVRVMVTEIYTQVTTVFNWPLAAVLSLTLLAVSLAVAGLASRLIRTERARKTV
jgi:putative spermidine/putrescine transport system permease protein